MSAIERVTPTERAHMEQLLSEGASYREVARTTGRSSNTVARLFPFRGWSQSQGGKFGCLIRYSGIIK